MRPLLSLILAGTAVGLLSHGIFLGEEAREALGPTGGSATESTLRRVQQEWPYSEAATQATTMLLDRWIASARPAEGTPFLSSALARIEGGVRNTAPYLDPAAAAALGLAALLLALVIPGTRFRGLTLLLLLGGGLTAAFNLVEPGDQAELVRRFEPLRHLATQFPRIAVGLVFMGGFLLALRRPRRESEPHHHKCC